MPKQNDRLLLGFLERISWRVLEAYPEIISDMIRRRVGVYALYKQERLHYVGLASPNSGTRSSTPSLSSVTARGPFARTVSCRRRWFASLERNTFE